MTNDQLKQHILDVVNVTQGAKGVEVAARCATLAGIESVNFNRALDELVAIGLLIEVDYVLPVMDYRAKSFYLPKGTVVSITQVTSGEPCDDRR